MNFRDVKKEALGVTVPVDLKDAVLEAAARSRHTLSAITTLALCRYLGLDPKVYHLSHRRSRPRGDKVTATG